MKGFNVSLGFTMTDFKGRKDKGVDTEDGPSPIPENLESTENQESEQSLPDNSQQ